MQSSLRRACSFGLKLSQPVQAMCQGDCVLKSPKFKPLNQSPIESWDILSRSYRRSFQFHTTPSLSTTEQCTSPAENIEHVAGIPMTDILFKDLLIERTTQPKSLPALGGISFGAIYTDHMLQVLHYGLECFEGMKAYRGPDKKVRLFRPDCNMRRLKSSATRLSLPSFSEEDFLECLKQLVREERDWVPSTEGFSLYIRPTMIATTPFLGVGPPSEALLFVVLAPVGPFFPSGLKPIRLFVDTRNARAFPGGVGDRKVGGNYAPTIMPQVAAAQKGCSQVLYVLNDGRGCGGLVGEAGAMNVFFLLEKEGAKGNLELVTPPLDGLILPGVTRDSVLSLVRSWDEFDVVERPIRFQELEDAHNQGRLLECFSTGTAVIIQPIGGLLKDDGDLMAVPFDEEACSYWTAKSPGQATKKAAATEPFSLSGRLFRALADIQYGLVDHPWSVIL